jgi:hypothetical protein
MDLSSDRTDFAAALAAVEAAHAVPAKSQRSMDRSLD